MRLKSLFAASAAGVVLSTSAQAANLITNGDFSAGATGFGSDYTYVAGANSAWDPAVYAIDNDPNDVHDLWSIFGDHTTGLSNMMIVNGSPDSGDRVWFTDGLTVTPDTDYLFSAWVASTYPDSPALLDFSINGAAIAPTFTAAAPGTWTPFFATWNSGSATIANIALVDRNEDLGGNDFALDDISFDTRLVGLIPEPATWAMMILGFAGMGAALRTGRRSPGLAIG